MNRNSYFALLIVLLASVAIAQEGQRSSIPPQQECEYDGSRGNQALRRVSGEGAAPFFFACQTGNPNADASGCIQSTLAAGFVTTIDREVDGWACIHGEGSISGWIPSRRLEAMPQEPEMPTRDWGGWWRRGPDTPGHKGDRLLITRGKTPNSLHVSGRAYWYGLGENVNFGQVTAEAVPVGRFLHAARSPKGGCVVDLHLTRDDKGPKLQAKDNERCGGVNVRFNGVWRKFVPGSESKRPSGR